MESLLAAIVVAFVDFFLACLHFSSEALQFTSVAHSLEAHPSARASWAKTSAELVSLYRQRHTASSSSSLDQTDCMPTAAPFLASLIVFVHFSLAFYEILRSQPCREVLEAC